MLFLFFAATWAQIDFLNLLIPTKSSTVCQVTLIVSTGSDQLARIGIEQFLLWSVGSDNRVTAERLITQTIFGIRLVAGGLLVGFTRPQFAPVCVAQTSLLPVAILVLALDLIIIGMLMIRAISSGMMGGQDRVPRSGVVPGQDKALVLCVVGFFSWTGVGVFVLEMYAAADELLLRLVLRCFLDFLRHYLYLGLRCLLLDFSFLSVGTNSFPTNCFV